MNIRNNELYLSYTTHKALRMVAVASEIKCADELAEKILNEWLTANHPEVIKHIADQWEAGEAFSKALHLKLKPKKPLE